MIKTTWERALRITGIYVVFGVLWIWLSDWFLGQLGLDARDIEKLQSLKGSVFVVVTGLLIYTLLRRELNQFQINQTELQKSKSLLEATLDSLSEAVFVINPADRSIVLCNQAAENIFGYKKEDLVGQSTRKLHVDEDHYRRFHEIGLKELQSRGRFSCEFQMRRANGDVFPTGHQVRAVYPESGWQAGVVSVILDLTQQKATERRLEHEQKVREAILENTMEAIIVCDAEGRLLYFNRAAREIHGLDAMPVTPDKWPDNYDLYHLDGVTPLGKEDVPLFRALKGERVSGFPMVVAPPGKEPVTILGNAAPLYDGEGNHLGAVTSFHDITDKINKEIALGQLEIAKKKMVSTEKLAEVGRLASGITHEILNPLNIISLHAQMILKDAATPPKISEKIRSIKEEVGRIETICRQLLTFSRQAPDPAGTENVQVNQILQHILELIERDSKYKAIEFVRELDPDLMEIKVNPDECRQVFFNLINNARQAMPGGGRITVKSEQVEKDKIRFVRIHVQDTGHGIHDEDLENIFQPFFTTKPEGEGTGMGLAVVHGIVEKHGGSITVHSKPGQGATFIIDFPAK